jgi:hypothetical protein
MDIWLKINLSASMAAALMLMIDFIVFKSNETETPGMYQSIGGGLIAAVVVSWPLYWLAVIWI